MTTFLAGLCRSHRWFTLRLQALSWMQGLGGPWSESRESLSRLEGRVSYGGLGQTYVQAPLGEAPT